MSTYGRLWEQVREARVRLKDLMPTSDITTLAAAVGALKEAITLIERWKALEAEMELLDDETGEHLK